MTDRRSSIRQPVDMLFNKYVEGYPYLCRTLDLSPQGMLVEGFVEPESPASSFPVELSLGGEERLWLWARRVWSDGKRQALEFLSMDARDRARLDQFLYAPG